MLTTQRPRDRKPVLRKARFELRTVAASNFIGLKTAWRGGAKVQVSDPARTLIDMLAEPALAGGIRHLTDMLATLMRDQPGSSQVPGHTPRALGSGAVFKRLGYLLQRNHPEQSALIELSPKPICRLRQA